MACSQTVNILKELKSENDPDRFEELFWNEKLQGVTYWWAETYVDRFATLRTLVGYYMRPDRQRLILDSVLKPLEPLQGCSFDCMEQSE